MPQYAFLGHPRVNARVTLSKHTHYFTWLRICVRFRPISSAVFKISDQWSVNVSSNLRSEDHCMQSVVCSLQSAVCSLQLAVSLQMSDTGTPSLSISSVFKMLSEERFRKAPFLLRLVWMVGPTVELKSPVFSPFAL